MTLTLVPHTTAKDVIDALEKIVASTAPEKLSKDEISPKGAREDLTVSKTLRDGRLTTIVFATRESGEEIDISVQDGHDYPREAIIDVVGQHLVNACIEGVIFDQIWSRTS